MTDLKLSPPLESNGEGGLGSRVWGERGEHGRVRKRELGDGVTLRELVREGVRFK